MFKNIMPLNIQRHKEMRIKPIKDFKFFENIHIVSVMAHEFSRCASIYPIVFLKDKEEFRPVALLGFKEGKNLFVKDGKWEASYIPAIVRRYPFVLIKTEESDRFLIGIDEGSELVNKEEGEALFDEEGNTTEIVERVKRYLTELQQMEYFTQEFCKALKKENMFSPLNMRVKVSNEIKNIGGAYVINEERLNGLSDEKFLEFRKNKYIPLIYSHLCSLGQIERLIKLEADTLSSNSS